LESLLEPAKGDGGDSDSGEAAENSGGNSAKGRERLRAPAPASLPELALPTEEFMEEEARLEKGRSPLRIALAVLAGLALALVVAWRAGSFFAGGGETRLHVYNGLGTAVTVRIGDRAPLTLVPFGGAEERVRRGSLLGIETATAGGTPVETLTAEVPEGENTRLVYNVAGAAAFVEWRARYGVLPDAADEGKVIGAPRIFATEAEFVLRSPPEVMRIEGEGQSFLALNPLPFMHPEIVMEFADEASKPNLIRVHSLHDAPEYVFLPIWLHLLSATTPEEETVALLKKRLASYPGDVWTLRELIGNHPPGRANLLCENMLKDFGFNERGPLPPELTPGLSLGTPAPGESHGPAPGSLGSSLGAPASNPPLPRNEAVYNQGYLRDVFGEAMKNIDETNVGVKGEYDVLDSPSRNPAPDVTIDPVPDLAREPGSATAPAPEPDPAPDQTTDPVHASFGTPAETGAETETETASANGETVPAASSPNDPDAANAPGSGEARTERSGRDLNPNDFYLAQECLRDNPERRRSYLDLLLAFPDNSLINMGAGLQLFGEGDNVNSRALLEKAFSLDPRSMLLDMDLLARLSRFNGKTEAEIYSELGPWSPGLGRSLSPSTEGAGGAGGAGGSAAANPLHRARRLLARGRIAEAVAAAGPYQRSLILAQAAASDGAPEELKKELLALNPAHVIDNDNAWILFGLYLKEKLDADEIESFIMNEAAYPDFAMSALLLLEEGRLGELGELIKGIDPKLQGQIALAAYLAHPEDPVALSLKPLARGFLFEEERPYLK
jgi:hypothetical protein